MRTYSFVITLLFLLVIPGRNYAQTTDIPQLAPEAARGLVTEGALFVDVREKEEVAALAYDLPGVMNLPLSELSTRLAELPTDQPIVLACRSGKRSSRAAAQLQENGFSDLHNLAGGIMGWQEAGLPVVKQAPEAAPALHQGAKACCSGKGQGKAAGKCGPGAAKKCGDGEGKKCCAGAGR